MTWEYIAGFFDGEGSITNNKKGFRITIAQANFEVLEQIKNFTGIGNIFKNKKRENHWKESWVFYIAKQNDVLLFLTHVKPYLIVKSKQTKQTIPQLAIKVANIDKKKKARQARITQAKKYRKDGLTYREIGKKMNIDFGYARRIILDN